MKGYGLGPKDKKPSSPFLNFDEDEPGPSNEHVKGRLKGPNPLKLSYFSLIHGGQPWPQIPL